MEQAANSMGQNSCELSELEMDALGESVNISMGAAAKALSAILDMKVLITTPHVSVSLSDEYEYKNMAPAVGVKIKYVEGLMGLNVFVIRQEDVKRIVNIMMGTSSEDSGEPLTELHTSAISEVMNQMMGASSTSLAIFFDRKIGISTPDSFLINENITAKNALDYSGTVAAIKFRFKIGEIIDSELMNVMPIEFAKNLANTLLNVHLHSENPVKDEKPPETSEKQGVKKMATGSNYTPVHFNNLDSSGEPGKQALSNLDIIMNVPLEVIVQIGKTKKQIMEILGFTQGSIIELDKQAGDPVDIIVNGELIAKGDVVVIDDNFGVRITQIIRN